MSRDKVLELVSEESSRHTVSRPRVADIAEVRLR